MAAKMRYALRPGNFPLDLSTVRERFLRRIAAEIEARSDLGPAWAQSLFPHMPRMKTPCVLWPGARFGGTGYGAISLRSGRLRRHEWASVHNAETYTGLILGRVNPEVNLVIGTHVLAHRMFCLDSDPIPDGMQINHRCDVRLCCNYEHLYMGDHPMNMSDLAARGSFAQQQAQIARMWR